MRVFLDFETRSRVDIADGVDRYARDSSTQVLCLAYAIDDEPVAIWTPSAPLPWWIQDLDEHVELHAHNARFERLIWRYCTDWPLPRLRQWHCTAAQAAAAGLPRALSRAADALSLANTKNKDGKRLIRKLCVPRKLKQRPGQMALLPEEEFCDDPRELAKLYEYCQQDVIVERDLYRALPEMAAREREVWLLDQRINDRGFGVDVPLVNRVLKLNEEHQTRLVRRLSQITQQRVTGGSQVARLLQWLSDEGVYVGDLTGDTVSRLLREDDLTQAASEVLSIRQQLSKSSVAKYLAFRDRTDSDGRMRGTHLYFGAKTGRWAGQGVQPQNIPRGTVKADQIDAAIRLVHEGLRPLQSQFSDVSGVLSSLIRPVIRARRGHRLLVVDFAGVEARVLAWIAGQRDLVAEFAAGKDTYRTLAAEIYGVPADQVSKDQRQVGKMARLGLGYGMGVTKFYESCLKAGVRLEHEFCEGVVATYRRASQAIVGWWKQLEAKAIECVETKRSTKAKGVLWYREGDWLMARLASRRPIPYYLPHLVEGQRKSLAYFSESSVSRKFMVERTYGGKLAENIVQGTCRDLLCDALMRLEWRGYRTVLHVHDEIVVEHPEGQGSLKEVEAIVAEVPAWAKGCPIGVEGFEARRYRK